MKFCTDFATNSRKEWRVSLFQSDLRKQIGKLPKILKSVKITHYYSYLLKYNNVFIIFHLRPQTGPPRRRRDQIEELHAKAADAKSAAEEAPGKEAAD